MKIKKWIKILLFKFILPEYAFMPWHTTVTKIEGKDRITQITIIRQARYSCFFKVKIDGIYDEPEVSHELWEGLHVGDEIEVRYRKSLIHDDIRGGRELQSIIPTKYKEILEHEEGGEKPWPSFGKYSKH